MTSDATVVVNLDDDSPTVSQDQLTFQDIPHVDSFTRDSGSSHGKSVGDKSQTHTLTKFPRSDDSEDEDRTDLLEGTKKQPSFWTFEYYQSFFDVDTMQVVRRIVGSMYPNPRSNYLQTHIRPHPDLYGPFWICTTLVFTIAVAGNLANYFHSAGEDYRWKYDFHKVTVATSAIFAYWWLMPTLLYGLLWWRNNQAGYTYTELLCIYGYSLAVYIPISILWVIQITWLQWLLVMIGMTLSGAVLVMTIAPAFRNDKKQIFLGVMSLIVVLHGLLAVGFMLYFFHIPDAGSALTTIVVPLKNVTRAVTKRHRILPRTTTPRFSNVSLH